MKKLFTIASLLLASMVASAYTIKDTANKIDLYTGSNSTPSISAATTGAVTIGPTAGVGSTGYHTTYGSLVGYSATGSPGDTRFMVSTRDSTGLAANLYRNNAASQLGLTTNTGYALFSVSRPTASSDTAFALVTNYQDAQTADGAIVSTNQKTTGLVTAAGDWTLGVSTSNAHSVNGVLKVGSVGSTFGMLQSQVPDGTNTDPGFFQVQGNTMVQEVLRLNYAKLNTSRVGTEVYVKMDNGTGTAGTISWNGASTVAYNTSSDRRLKDNIVTMRDSGLDLVGRMRPVDFTWKIDGSAANGFIAQELKEIYPIAVSGSEDGDPKTNPMGVDYGRITPVLVKAIQELKQQLDDAKADFAAYRVTHP